jgi:hypothetical protein
LQSLVIGFQSMAHQWRIEEIQIGHKETLNFKFKRWDLEFLSSDDENQYWQAPTRPKRRIKGGIFPDGPFPGHFSPLRWAIGRSKVQNLGVWTNQISGTPQIASAPKLNWILLRSCPPSIHHARDGRSRLAHSTHPVGRVGRLSQISLHAPWYYIELQYYLREDAYDSCSEGQGHSVRPSVQQLAGEWNKRDHDAIGSLASDHALESSA